MHENQPSIIIMARKITYPDVDETANKPPLPFFQVQEDWLVDVDCKLILATQSVMSGPNQLNISLASPIGLELLDEHNC